MIGGILLGVAYLIIGYVFITSPLAGILALAVYLAVLFALGGIARGGGLHAPRAAGQLAAVRYRRARFDHRRMLIGSGPAASVTLVTAIVGIEMLFSSFALFRAANLFKRA